MQTWEEKAHRIIAAYCRTSYLQTNPPPTKPGTCKRHRPYHVPSIAHALVSALAIHDEHEREHECKRLFEVERLGAWSLI